MHERAWEHLYTAVANKRVRAFLKRVTASDLNVSFLPRKDISEWNNTNVGNDQRPYFDHANDTGEWEPDEEEEQGNLMERQGNIDATEQHGVYMSYHYNDVLVPHDIAQLYSYRRLTVHPDTAMELIRSIGRSSRRTIAAALVNKFVRANHTMERDEEYLDGDVAPDWRGIDLDSDPALDALRFGNIQDLYRTMLQRKDLA